MHRQSLTTTQRTRRLRRESTYPERLLWSRLRAGQLATVRFRRQHPIGPFVTDFYCAAASLAIELDGLSHEEREQYDDTRIKYLESTRLRVIRFTNDQVLSDLDSVVDQIAREIGLET